MIRLPTLPSLPRGLIWAVAGALLTGLVLHSCEGSPPPVLVTRVDTADASQYRAQVEALKAQMADTVGVMARLRRTLEGRDTRRPAQVTVYDTAISLVHDTVILSWHIDGDGQLTQRLALPNGDTITGRPFNPAGAGAVRVADCDDGIQVIGMVVATCDRPRFGHLALFVGAGIASEPWGQGLPPPIRPQLAAGLRWQPSYRSPWAVELRSAADGRVVLAVRRGVRLW